MTKRDCFRKIGRVGGIAVAIALTGLVAGAECDANAKSAFRDSATSAVGDGIKTIFGGIVDGAVAAIQTAGDDTATDSNSSSTSSSTSTGS